MTRVRENKKSRCKGKTTTQERDQKKEKNNETICKIPFLVMHPKKKAPSYPKSHQPLRDALKGMFVTSS
jgi:hypothetical protein